MDVNFSDEDVNLSPPAKFLSKQFIEKLSSLANSENCYIAINTIYTSDDAKKTVLENLKKVEGLDLIALVENIDDCANKIVMLSRGELAKSGKI
jgi:hypothetical protein